MQKNNQIQLIKKHYFTVNTKAIIAIKKFYTKYKSIEYSDTQKACEKIVKYKDSEVCLW